MLFFFACCDLLCIRIRIFIIFYRQPSSLTKMQKRDCCHCPMKYDKFSYIEGISISKLLFHRQETDYIFLFAIFALFLKFLEVLLF